jgi:hypothetical protein
MDRFTDKGGNTMKRHWTTWSEKEDFIYILPLVAYWNDHQCTMFKFGWLKWRCGCYKNKED